MPTTLAIFSDVHANLPALEAVLDDLDRRRAAGSIDSVFCLGDLVGYAPWPNEVIDLIRQQSIPTIAGNYDEGVGLHSDDCGCAYKTDEDRARGSESIAFTNRTVTESSRRFLRGLPAHIRLSFKPPRAKTLPGVDLLMVHGSPRRINEYLFEERPDSSLSRIMDQAAADIMLFGHTHKPWHRIIETDGRFRHAINTGSVGKPKDVDPRAGYVLVTVDAERSPSDAGYCQSEFVRVPYDVQRAAEAILACELPDAFADMLLNGG